MHGKDLGWIAFEPGVVRTTSTGQIHGGGLKKMKAKHPEDIAMLPTVLQRGKLTYITHASRRRSALLEYAGYRAVLRLNYDDNRQTWALTHFRNVR